MRGHNNGKAFLILMLIMAALILLSVINAKAIDDYSSADEYIAFSETTAKMRKLAEDEIHRSCRTTYHWNRSEEFYCILSRSVAMKRTISRVQQMADDVFWELRPNKEVKQDFDMLNSIMDAYWPDWIQIDSKYQEYLEAKNHGR